MGILHRLRVWEENRKDSLGHRLSQKNEINKFKVARRKEIYSRITLTDKQKQDIDYMYTTYYGEKIPYTWHRHFTAFTGKFDVNYFPELLYIPEFERYMNLDKEYSRVLEDKNITPIIVQSVGVRTPKAHISCVNGVFRGSDYRILNPQEVKKIMYNIGEVFVKPSVDSCSGEGCFKADIQNGKDILSGKNIREILSVLGKNFVLQENIKCHDSIQKIYAESVNTFRIMTYIWRDKIYHCPVIMRIGRGGALRR